ncbi:hypothetical protein O3M35_010816 [Rhynocoris fuscipes]|uniref:Uncharacterized protein n=1 Tax=Rhynocoris fuscipes TaxID=488301 RepID=A0AAW1D3J2_9HEMI
MFYVYRRQLILVAILEAAVRLTKTVPHRIAGVIMAPVLVYPIMLLTIIPSAYNVSFFFKYFFVIIIYKRRGQICQRRKVMFSGKNFFFFLALTFLKGNYLF